MEGREGATEESIWPEKVDHEAGIGSSLRLGGEGGGRTGWTAGLLRSQMPLSP